MGGDSDLCHMVQCRLATADDAHCMAHISVEGWRYAYQGILPAQMLDALDVEERTKNMLSRMSQYDGVEQFGLVAVDAQDRVLGFIEGGPQTSPAEGIEVEIQTLYVHPKAHGRGIGKLLLTEAVRRFVAAGHRSMIVWTFRDNAAVEFYRKLGGTLAKESTYKLADVEYPDVGYAWYDLPTWLASH
ncbi:MAG: GNAT family N-acetyltransferase [Fimbriimonadaceae bacterium]|nr:GNAT family N-acetyltransferase [Fimbriimonadaceae bacterium]